MQSSIIKHLIAVFCLLILLGINNSTIAQTKKSAQQIKKSTSVSITIWTIDASHTWKGLQAYLSKAKSSGKTVYVGVLPPSAAPPINPAGSFSSPYRDDYITWAKEIAKLSVRYSNLKKWAIKDLQFNLDNRYLRQSYVDSAVTAGKSINSQLLFDPAIYGTSTTGSGDAAAPAAPTGASAVFHNANNNPNLPLSISPGINSMWNADWSIQSIQDRVFIVANPHYDPVNMSPSVSRIQLFKNDDYSKLANGKPRAEFQRRNFFFTYGHTFRYSFKNYFPPDFVFDVSGASNQNMLNQIKQTDVYGPGSPPRCFGHNGTQYYVDDYVALPDGQSIFHRTLFGNAATDIGKWVKWTVEFKSDSLSGAGHGFFKLYKNDVLLYSDNDRTWGYTKNPEFYLKLGAYKSDWLKYSSNQNLITVYIDDIQLEDLTTGVKSTLTDFKTTGDNVVHYNDLSWSNPSDSDLDAINIYSNSVNDPSTAKLIATVSKGTAYYRDYVTTDNRIYYWLKAKDTSGNLSQFSNVAVDMSTVIAPLVQ